jgi:ferritin-like protein
MASEGLHESAKHLRRKTRDMHRALVSLGEELEAVDWYRQRADACGDAELEAILLHNMREEMEHAAMLIEWLRRKDEHFHDQLQHYLFSQAPVTEIETDTSSAAGDDAGEAAATGMTIGSLKE